MITATSAVHVTMLDFISGRLTGFDDFDSKRQVLTSQRVITI